MLSLLVFPRKMCDILVGHTEQLSASGRAPLSPSPHGRAPPSALPTTQQPARRKDDAMLKPGSAFYSLRIPQPQIQDQVSYLSSAMAAADADGASRGKPGQYIPFLLQEHVPVQLQACNCKHVCTGQACKTLFA